jgi:transcriptional regulator with XRE-family HTH domain
VDFLPLERYTGAQKVQQQEETVMSLGSSFYHARKKSGLSQENVAEKLGVSRQTISKWETNETLPDIRQSKRLAMLYHMTLDELIEYDFDEQQAQQMIESVSDEAQSRIDWNKVWSKKYPVLATYHKTVRIQDYAPVLREMLTQLRVDYGYNNTDALLVLKDILARVWKGQM